MKTAAVLALAALFAGQADAFGTLCGDEAKKQERKVLPADAFVTPENYKVALAGDMGRCDQSRGCEFPRGVASLINSEGAEALFILGDYDYNNRPSKFERDLNDWYPADFPIFAALGNHESGDWNGYQNVITKRLEVANVDQYCWGDIGVNQACMYKGMLFVMSGVGTRGSGHVNFIDQTFRENASNWKLCGWHKNQRLMQLGGKSDEVGWEAYETCRQHGAIIATAHEHSYCRSHLMNRFSSSPRMVNTNNTLALSEGESFVFVSGVGGRSLRSHTTSLFNNEWWAGKASASSSPAVQDGAVFCTFHIEGNPNLAECYFKTYRGNVLDTWRMETSVSKTVPSVARMQQCKHDSKEEIALDNSKDDAIEIDGEVVCDGSVLDTSAGVVALRFNHVDLDIKNLKEQVDEIHLQVYGAEEANTLSDVTITAQIGHSEPLKCGAGSDITLRKKTAAKAVWRENDRDLLGWEENDVWVSVDLTDVVAEAIDTPAWKAGASLTLMLEGESVRKFYGFDASKCTTPHLSITRNEKRCE